MFNLLLYFEFCWGSRAFAYKDSPNVFADDIPVCLPFVTAAAFLSANQSHKSSLLHAVCVQDSCAYLKYRDFMQLCFGL